MYLRKTEGGGFVAATSPSASTVEVPLTEFAFVSAIRWNPYRDELLLTGTVDGNAGPDLSTNTRGDLRLYRLPLHAASWSEVYSRYAHDPVFSPEFGYAVHSGAGIAFVDEDGGVQRIVKVGRFNWGCPALSVSPDGRSLGWVRWKGDDMKPRVETLDGESIECRSSVARYCWFSDDTLLARNGGLPFLLEVSSGRTATFAKDVRADLADAPGTPEHLRDLLGLPKSKVWEFVGDLARVGDRVYIGLAVTEQRSGGQRFDGLVSVDLDGKDAQVVATLGAAERLEGFDVRSESTSLSIATYEDLTVVGRRVDHLGPLADALRDGWVPIQTSSEPSFGSHAPLGTA